MSNSEQIFFLLEVSDKGCSSFRLLSVQIFLELRILGLEKHGNLFILLFLDVGLLLRTVGSGMTSLSTNRALDVGLGLGLERAGPGPVAFHLAVLAVVVVNALNL